MAVMNVNPTRMELTRLKRRLIVAKRGHKLLKDKRDELMKKFLELVKKNKELREKVDKMLGEVHLSFLVARSVMSSEMLEEALMFPKQNVSLDVSAQNIMSVKVPVFNFATEGSKNGDIYPYGFAATSGDLDNAITALSEVTPYLLELAQVEKTVQLLADEIERTRRRVNALEYVLIPQLNETIKHITMKLDENERGNLTRLMKVKDMMIEQARKATKYIVPVILSSALLFTTTGCSLLSKGNEEETLKPPLEVPTEIKYTTIEVTTSPIKREIRNTAELEISSGTVVYSKYGGRLKKLYVNKMQVVNKGDILAEFETDSLEVELKKCEIALEKARLNAEYSLSVARRNLEQAYLQLEELKESLAQKEQKRELALLEGGPSVSSLEEEIEAIKSNIIKQEIAIEGLKANLESVEISSKLDIENAEYRLNQVKKELDNVKIISPVDGVIYDMGNLKEGETVGAYSTMFTIVKPEDVMIRCTGANTRYFDVGMKVTVMIGNESYEGEVVISPTYTPDTDKSGLSFQQELVLIKINGLQLETLAKRMNSILVSLVLDQKDDAVVIPRKLIQNYLGNKYVYVLENGVKMQRYVDVGIETTQYAEIREGLKPGDILIDS